MGATRSYDWNTIFQDVVIQQSFKHWKKNEIWSSWVPIESYSWIPNKRTGPLVKTAGKSQGGPLIRSGPLIGTVPEKLEKIRLKIGPERHFTRHREFAVNISRIWFPIQTMHTYLNSARLTGFNSTKNIEILQKLTVLESFYGIRNILDICP